MASFNDTYEQVTPINMPKAGLGGGDEWFSWAETQPGIRNVGGMLYRKKVAAPVSKPRR